MMTRLSNTTLWQFVEVLTEHVTSLGTLSIAYSTLVAVLIFAWYILNQPVNIVKDLSDVGYDYLTKASRRRKVQELVRRRNKERPIDDIPPVYPNGWFLLVESRDLKVGEARPAAALGREFAVFRGGDKKAYVVDAFCPHLGAHLGIGGKVHGSCIECPFHGWRFRGEDGACIHVPYSDKVPEFSKVKVWTSCELNGGIFVWHHAENEPPQWQVPDVPEITTGQWQYKGRTEHAASIHIQDVMENGCDVNHFDIHHTGILFKTWDGLKHSWISTWEVDTLPNEHVAKINMNQSVAIFGLNVPFFSFNFHLNELGPGLVHVRFTSLLGDGVFIHHVTPEGPLRQRLIFHMYSEKTFLMSLFARLFFIPGEAAVLEQDIKVWNNKMFRNKPTLVAEDRLISKYRRYYSQFYTKNSPTLKSIREKSLMW